MKMKTLTIAGVLVTVASAQANLISNGSFELSDLAPTGSFYTLNPGATDITDWSIINTGVANSSIDYIDGYWQPSNGNWSIDLAGLGAGEVAQNVGLTVGQWYHLTFDLAGNPDGGPLAKVTVASAGGTTVTETFNVTGANTKANMGWKTYGFYFQATSTPTTISFASGNGASPYGPALDNVSLTNAPGPAAALPMALGLLAKFRRRRSTK